MAPTDDANHDESGEGKSSHDRGESGFGPPVSEFGPPLDAFGPPTKDAAPVGWQPADEPSRPAVGWQPADEPSRPVVGWQPADEPSRPAVGWQPAEEPSRRGVGWQPVDEPSRPAVGWQAADGPATPAVPAPPQQYRAPDSTGSRETVRAPGPDPRHGPPPETVRYSDQGGAQQGSDQGTWWHQGSAPAQGAPQRPPTGPQRQVAGQSTGPRSLWDDDDLAKKLQAPREPAQGPKGSPTGSLWGDDDLVENFGSPRQAAPVGERGGRGRGVLIGGVAAVVVVVAAIAAVVVLLTHGRGEQHPAPPVAVPTTTSAADCQASVTPDLTIGNGLGDTKTGQGAILGYWHAFLVNRNADLVHSFTAPDANLLPSPDLQKAIDAQVPTGVTYCVKITTLAPDQFNVNVTQRESDGKVTVYRQLIETTNLNGKTVIHVIHSLA